MGADARGTRLAPFSSSEGRLERCERCAMHLRLCLCSLIEPLALETRVVVLTHAYDARRPTNTARLAILALSNAELHLRGARGVSLEGSDFLNPQRGNLLLFPTPDSVPLRREEEGRALTLVVPDGTWRQAKRVRSRVSGLAELPAVHLPPGPPSRYRLRHQVDPTRLSTFEAVARALGVLEGPEVQARLEDLFEVMVERTLWSRGQLAGSKVRGGIPAALAAALAADKPAPPGVGAGQDPS